MCGGDTGAIEAMLSTRATELTAQITAALDALDAADADTAHDIDEAFGFSGAPAETRPASAVGDIVSGWPTMGQDRIAAQIAAMTPEQRHHLITTMPQRGRQHRRRALGDAHRGQPDQHRRCDPE